MRRCARGDCGSAHPLLGAAMGLVMVMARLLLWLGASPAMVATTVIAMSSADGGSLLTRLFDGGGDRWSWCVAMDATSSLCVAGFGHDRYGS